MAKGPGTLLHSTAGFYHALEFVIVEAPRRGRTVTGLEVKVSQRYVDAILDRRTRVEFKNFVTGFRGLTESNITRIIKDLDWSRRESLERLVDLDAVLPGLTYVLRVSEKEFKMAVEAIREALIKKGKLTPAQADLVNIERFGSPPFAP